MYAPHLNSKRAAQPARYTPHASRPAALLPAANLARACAALFLLDDIAQARGMVVSRKGLPARAVPRASVVLWVRISGSPLAVAGCGTGEGTGVGGPRLIVFFSGVS